MPSCPPVWRVSMYRSSILHDWLRVACVRAQRRSFLSLSRIGRVASMRGWDGPTQVLPVLANSPHTSCHHATLHHHPIRSPLHKCRCCWFLFPLVQVQLLIHFCSPQVSSDSHALLLIKRLDSYQNLLEQPLKERAHIFPHAYRFRLVIVVDLLAHVR